MKRKRKIMLPIRRISVCGLLLPAVCALLLSACGTPASVSYLQDIQPDMTIVLQEAKAITLQPGDRLSIVVYSRDSELVQMFNLYSQGYNSYGNSNRNSCYTVDEDGKIDMPVLGVINVQGLTRMELAGLIKYRLLAAKLVRDPTVTVEYADLTYSVLGEVNSPGRKKIEHDHITLLDAIAEAGDLTIYGKRDNILVLRTEDGIQTPYRVDITQTGSLYSSPAYYLKQNDVIYVEPNQVRANQSQLNANTLRTPSFWFSAASFLMTLILFFSK